jgi:solute carrier family 25 uncoupling protein 8/9
MVFASLRIGLYEPVKNLIVGDNYPGLIPVGYRILAAMTTGAIGITVANPTDVVKIRFQADGRLPK